MLVPDISPTTGGIAVVSQGAFRLFGEKQREGGLEVEVLSLRAPHHPAESPPLKLRHFRGNQLLFSAAAVKRAAEWADLVFSVHVGLSQIQCFTPRRWVTFLHGLEVWTPLPFLKKRALLKHGVIANSHFTLEKTRKFNPWLTGGTVCHLGAPDPTPSAPYDWTARLGFEPAKRDILIVGRMAKGEGMKGHRELFLAMKAVKAAAPGTRLIVAGAGDDLDRHREMAGESGAGEKIHFTGFVPDEALSQLYQKCGVFCLPSWQEGFGLVYLEAMRAGIPCVASNADAGQEVVADEKTGLVVAAKDPDSLARALVRLVTDDTFATRLGQAGKARFASQFTEAHFHRRLWDTLSAHF